MKKNLKVFSYVFLIAVLSACSTPKDSKSQNSTVATVEDSKPIATVEVTNQDIDDNQIDVEYPAWFYKDMKDVNSNSLFKVADFEGKVILVESMAVWCPKCLSQQKEVARLHTLLSERDDFVSLGIDIDPNEDETLLADYVKKNGFNWLYAVASDDLIDEISALYGAQFLNPPSTPMLIIDKQGNQHTLPFGIKSAEALLDSLQPFLEEE